MNQKEIIKKLVERSWSDSQFKAEFIADPVAVIEKETGEKIKVTNGRKIVVVDQSDSNTYYLNLSRYIHNRGWSDSELSDAQLEAVAGGAFSAEDCPPNRPGRPPQYPDPYDPLIWET